MDECGLWTVECGRMDGWMQDCDLDLGWVTDAFGLAAPDVQVLHTRTLTVRPNQHKDVQETKTGLDF